MPGFHHFLAAVIPMLAAVAAAAAQPTATATNTAGTKRTDLYGDPLPPGAVARLGTMRFRHASIDWLAFGSDSHTLVCCEGDGIVHVWETESGRERLRLTLQSFDGKIEPGASKGPGGRMLVTWTGAPEIRVWDTTTGKPVRTLTADSRPLGPAAVSGAGDFVAAVGTKNDDYKLFMWEAHSGKLLSASPISLPEGWAASSTYTSVFFEGHGNLVLVRLTNLQEQVALRLWDVASCKPLVTLADNPHKYPGCKLAPDGKSLVTYDGALRLVDIASGKEVPRFGIGTLEARKVLQDLAKGDPAARLTREARAALARLGKETPP